MERFVLLQAVMISLKMVMKQILIVVVLALLVLQTMHVIESKIVKVLYVKIAYVRHLTVEMVFKTEMKVILIAVGNSVKLVMRLPCATKIQIA